MKRASPVAIDRIKPFLEKLGRLPRVTLRKVGVFYRAGRPFAHFHEEEGGVYIDVRRLDGWTRFPITTVADQRRVLEILEDPNDIDKHTV